jgi:hypothetical protein
VPAQRATKLAQVSCNIHNKAHRISQTTSLKTRIDKNIAKHFSLFSFSPSDLTSRNLSLSSKTRDPETHFDGENTVTAKQNFGNS